LRRRRALLEVKVANDNSLFYTFSTIAQAIAGALGLLGAFVLFRVQFLKSQIDGYALQVVQAIDSAVSLHRELRDDAFNEPSGLQRDGRYDKLFEWLAPEARALLREIVRKRDELIRDFRFVLILSTTLIFFAALVLSCAGLILKSALLTISVFVVGLAWLGLCLIKYVQLMLRALN
jgi:hypothetical protein